MILQLDDTLTPRPLSDGKSSWNDVAAEALGIWNRVVPGIRFTTGTGLGHADGDQVNQVFFSQSVYGHPFGNGVLAITTTWRVGTERVEGDTVFNKSLPWDSYRGTLDYGALDLRRVAIHEFGHTVGLDHPDQAGQLVVAIMNSRVSDLDNLADDDERGARALYADPNSRYTVNLNVIPAGAGSALISPPSPFGDGTYDPGTLVRIVPKPAKRFRFNFWTNTEPIVSQVLKFRIYQNEQVTLDFSSNSAPRVVAPPRSQLASAGDTVTFRVRATGVRPSFQWQFNGVDLPGETHSTLTVTGVGHENSGLYSVLVTNARGQTVSKPARLIVDGY